MEKTKITPLKKRQVQTHRMQKLVTVLCTAACMTVMLSTTAFAADSITVNSQNFMSSAKTALSAVVTLIGGGIGILGVINLVQAYSEENPASKSSGMKQLAAGVGLIICAQALVPVIFNMVSM